MDLSQLLTFDLNYYSSEARNFFSSNLNYNPNLSFKKSNVFYGIEEFERDYCLNNPIFKVRRNLESNFNKFGRN